MYYLIGTGSHPSSPMHILSVSKPRWVAWFAVNILISDLRWWYSGEHSCLPSSWPGFDSQPSQSISSCCVLYLSRSKQKGKNVLRFPYDWWHSSASILPRFDFQPVQLHLQVLKPYTTLTLHVLPRFLLLFRNLRKSQKNLKTFRGYSSVVECILCM